MSDRGPPVSVRRAAAAVAAAGFLLAGLPAGDRRPRPPRERDRGHRDEGGHRAGRPAAGVGDAGGAGAATTLGAESELRVTALLRNTSADSTGPISVRLRRGLVLDTRGELQAADHVPPPTLTASGPPLVLENGLTPGASARVTYRTSVAELRLGTLGVYPAALTVQSTDDGRELGRVQTQLPFFPAGIDTAGTQVALLWPLLDRPHRLTGAPAPRPAGATGGSSRRRSSPTTGWPGRSSRGGRLDQLLAAVEQLPEQVRLTLVVDPEIIEALDRMTAGLPGGDRQRAPAAGGRPRPRGWPGCARRPRGTCSSRCRTGTRTWSRWSAAASARWPGSSSRTSTR